MERPEMVVLEDVIQRKVSIQKAKEDYGVVLIERDGVLTVNQEATQKLRAREGKG